MASTKVYTDGDPETSSVDGYVINEVSYPTADNPFAWNDMHNAATGRAADSESQLMMRFNYVSSNKWNILARSFLTFDLSAIAPALQIADAWIMVWTNTIINTFTSLYPKACIYGATNVNSTSLVSGDYNNYNTTPLSNKNTLVAGTGLNLWHAFHLNNEGLNWLNKGGITKFALLESQYDVANNSPGIVEDTDQAFWVAWGSAEVGTNRPYLWLFYNMTSIPVVVTDAATNTSETGATLNGTLSSDGGEACTVGFDYGKTASYGETTIHPTAKNSSDTFARLIGSLDPGTTYHFRAFAYNSTGVGYGEDTTFSTTGETYPTEEITRVSSLVHRYSRGDRSYSLEILLGGLSSEFGLPRPIKKPIDALPGAVPVCGKDEVLAWSVERGYFCLPKSKIPPEYLM